MKITNQMNEVLELLESFLVDCYQNAEVLSMDELYDKAEAWQCENSEYNDIIDDYWIHQLAENIADNHWRFIDEDDFNS